MHIGLNFYLHENSQRSIKSATGHNEQISLYISRLFFRPKFHEKRKKLEFFRGNLWLIFLYFNLGVFFE